MRSIRLQPAAWTFIAVVVSALIGAAWLLGEAPTLGSQPTDAAAAMQAGGYAAGQSATHTSPEAAPPASTSPWSAASPTAPQPQPGHVPAALELPFLQASLSALQTNGADLAAPMRSRHVVQVTDVRTAEELRRWGHKQGFTMSSDRFYLHGGIEAQMLYFDRTMAPDALRIQLDGLAILQALTGMDTAEYGTWVGEINRR